ncbi:MAG TPA: hypothetical protein VE978_12055 [Chitinophagales bacterium]|nr:hypothetical protein [Chitinophagales bacterium]
MKKKGSSKQISSRKKKAEKRPAKKASTRKSLAKKKTKKSEDQFPGYPHYPSNKDIMNPKNKIVKEEFTETSRKLVNPKSRSTTKEQQREIMEQPILAFEEEESMGMAGIPEGDVSEDEKQFLEADELSEDMGEDGELRTRVWAVDMAGQDLDVPGTELDDEAEDAGIEDEENNIYSIGGDRHEGLEEANDRGK